MKSARLTTRRKDVLQKVRVLIAVEPIPLLRVIEYLFGEAPEIQIISRLHEALHLVRQVKRLQPDLIIVNSRLLRPSAFEVFSEVRRASPNSKLILTDFNAGSEPPVRQWGVDAYLEEEAIVQQLLATIRQLTAQRSAEPDLKSEPRARHRNRRP